MVDSDSESNHQMRSPLVGVRVIPKEFSRALNIDRSLTIGHLGRVGEETIWDRDSFLMSNVLHGMSENIAFIRYGPLSGCSGQLVDRFLYRVKYVPVI